MSTSPDAKTDEEIRIEKWSQNPLDGTPTRGLNNVMRMDDSDEGKPYQDGDYSLIADVVAWLMRAYDEARQDWNDAHQTFTEDILLSALTDMHPNWPMLLAFRRFCRTMESAVIDKWDVMNSKSPIEESAKEAWRGIAEEEAEARKRLRGKP